MMKKYVLGFITRGLLAASGGPVVMAIIYGILGANGTISLLTPEEVCKGILTVTLMAFIASGIGIVYGIERLPLLYATLIHAVILYADYLIIYLMNDWIPKDGYGIGGFTIIYALGYALVWMCIMLSIKIKTEKLNRRLGK